MFFAFAIFLLIFFFLTRDKSKEVDKSKDYFKTKRNFLSKLTNNYYFKRIDKFLKDAGYPLNIEIETYILMMFLTVILLFYTLFSMGIQKMLILAFLAIIPLHTYLYKSYIDRKNKIQISLCDIQDIVYFQSKIGTPIDVILANSARIAKEPLKIPLEQTASCYKVTRNLNKALNILKESSNIMEIQAFCFILEQKEQTGFSEQNHKAQAIMMKRNKRLKKRLDREMKRNKLILASILLFTCYIFMVATPILKGVFININKIMR